MTKIFVDADGCPVKNEVYRVAERCKCSVVLVANSWMKTPNKEWIEFHLVNNDLDAADEWIVKNVQPYDIVITADIPLASGALKKGAYVISPRGRVFDDDNIGDALATRELQTKLRDAGIMTGGPSPFTKKNRSHFLQSLDLAIRRVRSKCT